MAEIQSRRIERVNLAFDSRPTRRDTSETIIDLDPGRLGLDLINWPDGKTPSEKNMGR